MDAAVEWNKKSDEKGAAHSPAKDMNAPAFQEQAWLLGQPPLGDYVDFVEDVVKGGADIPRSTLVDEWRTANDHYQKLERSEAGIADDIEVFYLDEALTPLVEAVKADARYKKTFDTLPTRFAMVELDLMMVGQNQVMVSHTDRLENTISPDASPEELFEFCQPVNRDEAPVEMRKLDSLSYQFSSPSMDFRFQDMSLIEPEKADPPRTFGPTSHIVGALVGYGSNFLSLVEWEDRLVLHNGHHRAYTLRSLGFTHVPCIIQTVTRMDELQIAASRAVRDDPSFYFRMARPPLLKDFFDPKIGKIYQVHKEVKVIEVSFEVKEYRVRT